MRITKRDEYIKRLYLAFHTFTISCANCDIQLANTLEIIKTCYQKKIRNQDKYRYYMQINPNKFLDSGMITKYLELQELLLATFDCIAAEDIKIIRADLSINSDDITDYEAFKKLNRLIICCIADCYDIKNCYQTYDLWTYKSLNIAIKDSYIEAENYDKDAESSGKSEIKNRLELRSKRINCYLDSLADVFFADWSNRLDKSMKHFEAVQERYNNQLIKIWTEDNRLEKKSRKFSSRNAFLIQSQDCIFTKKQLIDLLDKMGVNNSQAVANRVKNNYKIEFFSKVDLKIIINSIKKLMEQYFSN